ncbi:hypothetical protein KVR01_010547 [Diaporthe batatas]|uniref:uncharacterized protein n=1 Tax=Diaporthe batatas TaxID=748121 RepID=UPI001D03C7AE|nr:uncharacterized protein KVR01_010547 [Diaporthe batatas]KAG8159910.1 hypothetical protein KVR01_010547 [Diaporthe batatas]
MLLDRPVLAFFRRLPFGLGDNSFTRYNFRAWELQDRYHSHHEMGDVWMHVTPVRNWLYIGDPEIVTEIWKRGRDFPRETSATAMLDVFGENIATSQGEQWRRHRRLVNNSFNDQNNRIVWSESINVASDVLQYWISERSVKTTADDTRTLALHVMSRAGFGRSFKFQGRTKDSANDSNGPTMNYKDSLKMILDNCVLIFVFGPKFLSKAWLPQKLRSLHKACVSFQQHMTEAYEEEKRVLGAGESQPADQNFLTLLVRASQGENQGHSSGVHLTESEIYGNMFTFNFAGHDTTAHTFTFALYFLAAFPEVQDWINEEIRHVAGTRYTQEMEYELDFPRLRRCLAVMLETLRIYTPVPTSKFTDTSAQTLRVGRQGKTITDPKWWGTDSLQWRPSRWIEAHDQSSDSSALCDEELLTPQRGTYVAWSGGARDCPGRKFSQVEFVATLATLFRDHRVEPVPMAGETPEASRKRVLHLIETDSAPVLLLQMLHPERAPLRWSRR